MQDLKHVICLFPYEKEQNKKEEEEEEAGILGRPQYGHDCFVCLFCLGFLSEELMGS